MKALLSIAALLVALPLHADCPRDSTVLRIFDHLEDAAQINIDGRVWRVDNVTSAVGFIEGEPKSVIGKTTGASCSYEAQDRFGNKRNIIMRFSHHLRY